LSSESVRRHDEIKHLLLHVLWQGNKIMSDTSGLTTSIAALKDEVAALGTQMDANYQALLAAQSGGNQAAIDAAKADIDATIDALKAIGTRDTFPPPAAPLLR
jgi:hypothetical protein